jgi:hypothetical protein
MHEASMLKASSVFGFASEKGNSIICLKKGETLGGGEQKNASVFVGFSWERAEFEST